MEMEGRNQVSCCRGDAMNKKTVLAIWAEKVRELAGIVTKPGRDDPRKIIHSFKVGLCLTLVSLLYLVDPVYDLIGENAVWAAMSVVVVLEFATGAAVCKGMNRILGTLCAASLVYLLKLVADKAGTILTANFIGIAVLVTGLAATYVRFIPHIKKNYDYGIVVFLLTFTLLAVSSYRGDDVLKVAYQRVYTVIIGSGVSVIMSSFLCPNLSSLELQNSTISKLEGLAESIVDCVDKYFEDSEITKDEKSSDDQDPINTFCKSILSSRKTDETLELHASWELKHLVYRNQSPWKQYVELGDVLRNVCGTLGALHGCSLSKIQAPRSVRDEFKLPCTRVAREISYSLRELAECIRNKRLVAPIFIFAHLHEAIEDLDEDINSELPPLLLRDRKPVKFCETTPITTFTMLLERIATEELDVVMKQVEKLGRSSGFRECAPDKVEIRVSTE